jgi:tRNA threonylcarbamoyladenosine biosynthesis protein TsaB
VRLLSLETATAAGAAALVVDGEVVGEEVATQDRRHAESLLPSAIALLEGARIEPAALDGIVIDVGPGLFTGLRVGIATARSLAFATGVPLYVVTSLEVLANDPAVREARSIWSVVDARRHEVFVQRFERSSEQLVALDRPHVTTPDALRRDLEVASDLEGAVRPIVLVGDGAQRYGDRFADVAHASVGAVTLPSPGVAGQMVERGGFVAIDDPSGVLPLYLRDPDAVANFTIAAAYDTR